MRNIRFEAFAAEEAGRKKEAENLNHQADIRANAVGPDFVKMLHFDEKVSPHSPEGKKFFEVLESAEKACGPYQKQ